MPTRLKTDNVMFGVVLAMVFFGLVMVYSASAVKAYNTGLPIYYYFGLQCAWAVFAIPVMMWFKRTSYLRFQTPMFAFGSIGVVLMLLLVVYFVDRHHRWLRFGLAGVQPSELAKPALVIFLAFFATWRARAINNGRYTLLPASLFTGLVIGGVVAADLGTAVVLAITAATVFFVAGIKWQYFVIAGLAAVVFLPVFIWMEGYRLGRVAHWMGQQNFERLLALDPTGSIKASADAKIKSSKATKDPNYQKDQSIIAIGSGGVFGLGLMNGRQKVTYLPEAHTDFIFGVIGEEAGLLGSLALLLGYLTIAWRGLRTVLLIQDDFGRYLALGATTIITVQALMNITVALGMMPTKGITLPLISYGGSSLMCTLVMVGILMNVAEHVEQR